MLDALNLPTRVRTAIGYRCEWKKISEMTLREVMELVIPDQGNAKPGYLVTHMLDFRKRQNSNVLAYGEATDESNLGTQCNLEWKRRLGRLMAASRIVAVSRQFSVKTV